MNKDLQIFNNIVNKLLEEEKTNPVTKPIDPEALYKTLDLSLSEEASLEGDFVKNLEKIVLNTPKTATNLFFNQLFGGRNSRAYLGELLAVMLNNSMYTYKVAGPHIGIEKTIIKEIIKLIGFGNKADGTFAAGGSMTIFMAMIMARDAYNLDIVKNGVLNKMVMYTSKESHYSIPKNATFMGIGRNNVRYIKADKHGKMMVSELEKAIKEDIEAGNNPFCINATASTTVMGAFDPIDEIAEMNKKYNLWLHVDGAFGGSVIFSKKYKKLLKGVEKANSFSINAHKMLGTPLSTSMVIVNDKKHLYDSFSNEANYLYQTDGDDLNLGKISLQCGRRNDAFKFWTLWKSVGTSGLEKIVDNHFDLAQASRDYIRNNKDYTLYSFDDSVTICFNYKNIPAKDICNRLYEEATLMVGFGRFDGTEFIRLVCINPENTKEDMMNFFRIMEEFVEKEFDV